MTDARQTTTQPAAPRLLEGFLTFFKIGLFTIGGGYAMIPLIEREVVTRRAWLTKEDFLDLMAVSQALPGVFAVNFSIYIGQKLRGLRGSLCFALGSILPSFLIILLLALFFASLSGNAFVEAMFKGIRPAVVALIVAPCISLARSARITIENVCLPLGAALLIWLLGVSPVYVIAAVAIGAYGYGRFVDN